MILTLRILFLLALALISGMATWASLRCALFDIPSPVLGHPWFLTTLVDAYLAFLTFYAWVAWKERHWLARIFWLLAIILLGNIAMAVYVLRELFTVSAGGRVSEVITRRYEQRWRLAAAMAVCGIGLYLYAWQQ